MMKVRRVFGLVVVVGLSGCAQMNLGDPNAKTVVTGSAGGATAQNESASLEKCSAPLGTLALEEDTTADWYGILTSRYRLGSTVPVMRLLIQQSNCFVIVERGRALRNMEMERAFERSGETRAGSKFHKGQMVAADYTISPSITFSDSNSSGAYGSGTVGAMASAVGGSVVGQTVGLLVGNMSNVDASTTMTMIENRSGVQIAAAEGSARATNFSGLLGAMGSDGGGSLGAYSRTKEGKVIVAAFMDAFNNIVRSVREYKAQEVKGGLGKGGQLKVGD